MTQIPNKPVRFSFSLCIFPVKVAGHRLALPTLALPVALGAITLLSSSNHLLVLVTGSLWAGGKIVKGASELAAVGVMLPVCGRSWLFNYVSCILLPWIFITLVLIARSIQVSRVLSITMKMKRARNNLFDQERDPRCGHNSRPINLLPALSKVMENAQKYRNILVRMN